MKFNGNLFFFLLSKVIVPDQIHNLRTLLGNAQKMFRLNQVLQSQQHLKSKKVSYSQYHNQNWRPKNS